MTENDEVRMILVVYTTRVACKRLRMWDSKIGQRSGTEKGMGAIVVVV